MPSISVLSWRSRTGGADGAFPPLARAPGRSPCAACSAHPFPTAPPACAAAASPVWMRWAPPASASPAHFPASSSRAPCPRIPRRPNAAPESGSPGKTAILQRRRSPTCSPDPAPVSRRTTGRTFGATTLASHTPPTWTPFFEVVQAAESSWNTAKSGCLSTTVARSSSSPKTASRSLPSLASTNPAFSSAPRAGPPAVVARRARFPFDAALVRRLRMAGRHPPPRDAQRGRRATPLQPAA